MTSQTRVKLATQVDTEVLAKLRDLAEIEGRELQTLIDEALADLIDKRKHGLPRSDVMAAYQASHDTYAPLYKKLAE